jgi:hypothetical protein
MTTVPSPDDLRKRANRAQSSDGITEILLGPTLIIASLTVIVPAFAALLVIPILVFAPLGKHLQARYIHPRVGYAKVPAEDGSRLARGMLFFLLGAFVLFVIGVAVTGNLASRQVWLQWAPALAAMLCSGGFLYAAERSGLVRFYVYLGILLTGGVVFSLLPAERPWQNVAELFTVFGAVMMIIGAVTFGHFLATHPLPRAEAADGSE